jgi:hypothetical protein
VTQIDRLAADVGVDQVAEVQAELVTAACRLRDVGEFMRLCAGWRHALRPDAGDAADDRDYGDGNGGQGRDDGDHGRCGGRGRHSGRAGAAAAVRARARQVAESVARRPKSWRPASGPA